MSTSFYLQFMKLQNNSVEPCKINEENSEISPERITQIVTMELSRYGIQHNPYILDFMTVLNNLTIKRRFILENLMVMADASILTLLCFLAGIDLTLSVGIGVSIAVVYTIIFPKARRMLVEGVYLFLMFIICSFDKWPKDNRHVMFSASGKIVVKVNEYLLKYSDKDRLFFIDELSVNDFIYQLTAYIQQNVSVIDKIKLCFIPGHRLHKYFISEKDFIKSFEA